MFDLELNALLTCAAHNVELVEQLASRGHRVAAIAAGIYWKEKKGAAAAKRAMKWWSTMSRLGDLGSMYQYAWLLRSGRGCQKKPGLALRWFLRAARRGHSDAQYSAGSMYSRGEGVRSRPALARHWYGRAAANGDVPAMYNLGYFYEIGRGGLRSIAHAKKWYDRAARLGDKEAKVAALRLRRQLKQSRR